MGKDFPKDKYGVRFTLPDSMTPEEKLESLDNIESMMKLFSKIAGEPEPDLSELHKARKAIKTEVATNKRLGGK